MAIHPSHSAPAKLIRAFIAVNVDEATHKALEQAVARLQRVPSRVRWVPASNRHLTVKFLGNVEWLRVGEVAQVLQEEAALVESFELEVRGLHPFPPGRQPRIVAAHVADPAGGLAKLNARLETAMEAFGIRPERRGFKAHLTLGRVHGQKGQGMLWDALARYAETAFGASSVEEAVLYQSELLKPAPRYTVLARARLGASEA